MSTERLPTDVITLIKNGYYADAIQYCKEKTISYTSIFNQVHDLAEQAKNEFDKKNYEKSIQLYIATIGIIEPSNVLCCFFQPHLTKYLTRYLIELHKRGYATDADTKLLFNLFYHHDERQSLVRFIQDLQTTKAEINPKKDTSNKPGFFKKESIIAKIDYQRKEKFMTSFNPISAVETLVDNEMNDFALQISQMFGVSKQIIDLMINTEYHTMEEKTANFKKAVDIINEKISQEPPDPEGRSLLFEFGPKLLRGDAEAARLVELAAYQLWTKSDDNEDNDFLRVFWGSPEHCKNFLKKAVTTKSTPLLVNAYIELLIPNNYFFKDHLNTNDYQDQDLVSGSKEAAIEVIRDPTIKIDDIKPLLFLCTELKFLEGVIELLRKRGNYSEIVAIYIATNNTKDLYDWIYPKDDDHSQKERPQLEDEDWVSILRYFAAVPGPGVEIDELRQAKVRDNEFMKFLVSKAKKSRALFSLIKELSRNPNIQFDVIKKELNTELAEVVNQLRSEEETHQRLVQQLAELEDEIDKLESADYEFKSKECNGCGLKLKDSYVGFFCGHSFHMNCCGKDGNDVYCLICAKQESTKPAMPKKIAELTIDRNTNDLLDPTVMMIESGYYSKDTY